MKIVVPLLIVLMLPSVPAAVQAKQGVSENMAECGALMEVTSAHIRAPDRKRRTERAARVWAKAAERQADIEGWIAGDLLMAYTARRDAWRPLGAAFMHTKEYRDWSSYCKALAFRYKVDVP